MGTSSKLGENSGASGLKMAGRKWNLVEFLCREERAVKFQVMFFLFSARIHHSVERYYRNIYGRRRRPRPLENTAVKLSARTSSADDSDDLTSDSNGAERRPIEFSSARERHLKELYPTNERQPAAVRELLRKGANEREPNVFELAPEASEWQWRGVPRRWRLVRFYERLSTCWCLYASLRTLLGERLFALVGLLSGGLLGLPGQCVLAGRFVLHPTVDHFAPLLMASFHIAWRSVQHLARRSYMMGSLIFLLQSEPDLDHFARLIKANARSDYLTGGACQVLQLERKRARGPLPACGCERELPAGSSAAAAQLYARLRKYTHLRAQQPAANCAPPPAGRSRETLVGCEVQSSTSAAAGVHEHFMRHLMCYEIHHQGRVFYRLRPNRTREARAQLVRRLALSTLVCTGALALQAAPIATLIAIVTLSDQRYVQTYAGCAPQLERLQLERRLPAWSFTLQWHRVFALAADALENAIIWLDSAFAILFVVTLVYLINHDVLLYWRHVHARLERARAQVDRRRRRELVVSAGAHCQMEEALEREEALLFELELRELQFELFDFFRQVERADSTVSDILTAAILIWLTFCALLSYYYLSQMDGAPFPLPVKLIQFFGLFAISLATNHLLKLRKCCLRSHKLVCSLMAQCGALETKRQFCKALDFFHERNRTAYTLFQTYPYLATTYLTIIGWSFSCFFVADALFGGERLLHKRRQELAAAAGGSLAGKRNYLDLF